MKSRGFFLPSLLSSVCLCSTGALAFPVLDRLEVVTNQAVIGDGGNNWGGHQSRIVRTGDGVFVAFTVPGTGEFQTASAFDREWRLTKRTGDNQWTVIAHGPSGREPMNLLAGPDGRLYLVAWPDQFPHLWIMDGEGTVLDDYEVPGAWEQADWPYSSAGISPAGDIVILQSTGGEVPGGRFIWSYYSAGQVQWSSHETSYDYRHAYTYIFPRTDGEINFVSSRDVRWTALGLCEPSGSTYSFNAVGFWNTPSRTVAMDFLKVNEANQVACDQVECIAQRGNYVDTLGRTHVLYFYYTQGTGRQHRHAVIENNQIIADNEVPKFNQTDAMIQDPAGRIYLLGQTQSNPPILSVYHFLSDDGAVLEKLADLSLGTYNVEYSGISIASPRGGTELSNFIDGIYPSGNYGQVIYFRVILATSSVSNWQTYE